MRSLRRLRLRYFRAYVPQRLTAQQIKDAAERATTWSVDPLGQRLRMALTEPRVGCLHQDSWYRCPEGADEWHFLYYKCTECGSRWNPWPQGSRRWLTARMALIQQQVIDFEGRRLADGLGGLRSELEISALHYAEDDD